MGTFGESFSKSFGKKTGNALGNLLYGKASDDKRVRIRTDGDVKMTSHHLKQEKIDTAQLEAQQAEIHAAQLEAQLKSEKIKQKAKEKERHLNQLDDIRRTEYSGTNINENIAILSRLISLLTYDADNDLNDFLSGDTEDQIKQKQIVSTAATKIKTGLAISKGIDPANGVVIALEQEFNDALNAVKDRDAKNKKIRNIKRILLFSFIAIIIIITGLMWHSLLG